MATRLRAGPALAACLALILGVPACRSAAALFLDLPPRQPQPQAMTQARVQVPAAVPGIEVEDTVRPAIEAVQNKDSLLGLLPADAAGSVDWVVAVRQGRIQPRRGLPGRRVPPDMSGFGFDFAYRGADSSMDAVFPHSGHVQWLKCEGCHTTARYRDSAPPSMEAILGGQSCGQCHGKVSFPATSCWRCHPRMDPPGDPPARPAMPDDELVLTRRLDSASARSSFPPARFSHWVHRVRFTCGACHNELFAMRAGADTVTMAGMREGKSCGACHDDKTAFGAFECARCHTGTTGGGPPTSPAGPSSPPEAAPTPVSAVPTPAPVSAAVRSAPEVAPPSAPVSPPLTTVPPPGRAQGKWYVQLVAFRTRDEAVQLAGSLAGKLPVVVVAGKEYFMVRSGPYSDKREAEAALASVRRQVGGEPFLVRGQ